MNGAILGMTKAEVARKLDEIVDFSGCERYLDTPVKRYSSGMMVRLGFAVAAHLDPEILVVDEVLAVGDAEFQKKAIGKMKDVSQGEGRTVLFVSHNMGSIRQLCKNAVVLDNGNVAFDGDVNSAVDYYINNGIANSLCSFINVDKNVRLPNFDRSIEFVSFQFIKDRPCFASNEDIELIITIKANRSKQQCRINCTIYDTAGFPVGSNTSFDTFDIVESEVKIFKYIILKSRLVRGTYSVSFSVGTGNALEGETNYDVVNKVVYFEIDRIEITSNSYYAKWENEWGNIFFETKLIRL